MSADAVRSCYGCAHLLKETESWEMSHIWWWSCCERPAMENLKSFPFKRTKCASFVAKGPNSSGGVLSRIEETTE